MIEQFEKNRFLKNVTTLGIGGAADYFIEVSDILTMQSVLRFCTEKKLPFYLLGKGSNVFFDDRGFRGVVIANRICFREQSAEGCWHVGAGYSFSLLGSQTAREGWTGLEFAAGIPGSVGGAVYMNAGANGCETASTLCSVDYVTADGTLVHFSKEELIFSYRHSSFQEKKGAIVGATFQLNRSAIAREKQIELIRYRQKTQPYDAKSAGCVFRNPPTEPAGSLIDKCGLKGKEIGGAQVSPLHANFLVNENNASSVDFLNLIQYVQHEVKNQTGIELSREIYYVPYDEDV